MILFGNIISLAESIVMMSIGLIKEKKNILIALCVQFSLYAAANFVLGGIMGAITNLVSLLRNLICLKWEFDLKFKLLFTAIQLGLAAFTNSEGWIGWLPIIAALSLTWFLDVKDEIKLKCVFLFGQILWECYDLHNMNLAGAFFDAASFITTIIGIRMILKERKSAS